MTEIFLTDDDGERDMLERRWLALVRDAMPAAARTRDWPVRFDHCFARILLDNAFDAVWYDRVAQRPAYRHVPAPTLAAAIALGEAVLGGTADLHKLNARSLDLRRARRAAEPA